MTNQSSGDQELSHKKKIFDESLAGNREFLRPRTITLVYRYRKSGKVVQGCGTLLSIGERVFVVTAGHVIDDNETGGYWVLTPEVRKLDDGIVAPVASRAHPVFDIGYLELNPGFMSTALRGTIACSLSDTADRGCGRPDRSTVIVGPPSEHNSLNREGPQVATLKASAMTYWTVPLQPEEWKDLKKPNDPEHRDFDSSVDIVLEYDRQGQVTTSGSGPESLPHPEGMSGGGIWDQDFDKDKVWSASSPKLIGVQSSWFEKGKYLRGTQLIHCLKMIYDAYIDLRPNLRSVYGEEHFDGISS
jgi:hypothetical protein